MELGLSLGSNAASKPQNPFNLSREENNKKLQGQMTKFDFYTALSLNNNSSSSAAANQETIKARDSREIFEAEEEEEEEDDHESDGDGSYNSTTNLQIDDNGNANNDVLQLNLLPIAPVISLRNISSSFRTVQSLPLSSDNDGSSENGSPGNYLNPSPAAADVTRRPLTAEEVSSANSLGPPGFRDMIDLGMYGRNGHFISNNNKRGFDQTTGNDVVEAAERASDDDDENGLLLNGTRKKLRLSKKQSAFLEESFKEHNTLNPKQKLALAKQLNLSPRQIEVWFQNRRARTKLKQTEVECEYLKRCCETLTGQNRRLQKELQELRALKITSNNPFHMQTPATTLTMCPSCERVASAMANNGSTGGETGGVDSISKAAIQPPLTAGSRRFHPFSQSRSSNIHHPTTS